MPRYLGRFVQRHTSFRIPELLSLAELFNESLVLVSCNLHKPYVVFEVSSEAVLLSIARRCILSKGFYEVWGEGATYDELMQSAFNYPMDRMKSHLSKPFRMRVRSFGRHYGDEEQRQILKRTSAHPVWTEGKVDLDHPQEKYAVLESINLELKNAAPEMIWFGRKVCSGGRKLIFKFRHAIRPYLGETSMDPELALVMANVALARPCSLICDPFVGTGSLLLTCAAFGSHVLGWDISPPVLRGRGRVLEGVLANFHSLELSSQFVGTFAADSSICPLRTNACLFDAIICDPPYGVRAGARRIGKKSKKASSCCTAEPAYGTHAVHGWTSGVLDSHDSRVKNAMICWSIQKLTRTQVVSRRWSRHLIVMRKVVEWNSVLHSVIPDDQLGQGSHPAHEGFSDYVMPGRSLRKKEKEIEPHEGEKTSSSSPSNDSVEKPDVRQSPETSSDEQSHPNESN